MEARKTSPSPQLRRTGLVCSDKSVTMEFGQRQLILILATDQSLTTRSRNTGIPAAIQQFLKQQILLCFAVGGGGNDRRNGRSNPHKYRLGVRQLADLLRRQGHPFSGSHHNEQRRQVLNLRPHTRSKSRSLAGGADRSVASGKFVFGKPNELFAFEFGQRNAFAQWEQEVVSQRRR